MTMSAPFVPLVAIVSTLLAAPAPPGPRGLESPASAGRPTASADPAARNPGGKRPNILFVVLDDIGIDATSWEPFGWNASAVSPTMPVMQAIADDSISFRNFWATPECSPSRACFMTGRWGHRTGVTTAIVGQMLPTNQLNPAEVTLPELLHDAGYEVGMFGKYHLGGEIDAEGRSSMPPGHGFDAPATTARLQRYEGYWSLPPSIDQTVGNQSRMADAPCGFPTVPVGRTGAACFPITDCTWGACETDISPLEALARGGLPLLDDTGDLATECDDCSGIDVCDDRGRYISDFMNAYYAWPELQVAADGGHDDDYPNVSPTREHLTDWISRRSAEWIQERDAADDPWVCMVTHSAAHTPLQTPPPGPLGIELTNLDCNLITVDPNAQYELVYIRMIEQLDESLGRMLLDLGYATLDTDGYRLADLAALNVQLIVMSDNGSYGYTVLPPFDRSEAKQSVYQTGVWVPCMVAGAGVNAAPGSRTTVDAMVNVVDLFELICDTAGIDAAAAVEAKAPGRQLDLRNMSGYLAQPGSPPHRDYNFAVYQAGMFGAVPGSPDWNQGGIAGACANGTLLIDQLIADATLCEDNGGVWLGDLSYCELLDIWQEDPCDPRLQNYDLGDPFPDSPFCGVGCGASALRCLGAPTRGQWAVRRGLHKLIVKQYPNCLPEDQQCVVEFYLLDVPMAPDVPGIESTGTLLDLDDLSPVDQEAYEDLRSKMIEVLESDAYCPGDGNLDGRIDALDLAGAIDDWNAPSWWDIDRDGRITGVDLGLILSNWNRDCSVNTVPRDDLPYNDPGFIPPCLLDG